MSTAYCVNGAKVIHEMIDGEAIMINLDNGNYYTMNDAGAFAWQWLQQRCVLAEVVRRVAVRYAQPEARIEGEMAAFVDHLLQEGLIVPAEPAANVPAVPAGAAAEYAAPVLFVFSDMQELLLLDPIHEISDQGWPHTDPAATGKPAKSGV